MFVPMLFYDADSQEPLPLYHNCQTLHKIGRTADFAAELQHCDLPILQIEGKLRQDFLRQILAAKKSFALLGLDALTLAARQKLARDAKKRHCQTCWLTSLRCFAAAARLQEIISSGCLGVVTKMHWQGGHWEEYRVRDLLAWLSSQSELPTLNCSPSPNGTISLQATLGQAEITLTETGKSSLRVKINNFPEKYQLFNNDPFATELATLLLLAKSSANWTVLAKL